jgi:hypothetical protein
MDPRIRIRIHTKVSWIRNTAKNIAFCVNRTCRTRLQRGMWCACWVTSCARAPSTSPTVSPRSAASHSPQSLFASCCGPANVVFRSVLDPGSDAFLTPGTGIWDVKKIWIRIRDEHPRSYRKLETVFWVKNA